jgi:hypothetical protein
MRIREINPEAVATKDGYSLQGWTPQTECRQKLVPLHASVSPCLVIAGNSVCIHIEKTVEISYTSFIH